MLPVFSGSRFSGDVSVLRPLFYGVLPPRDFLTRSVDYVREVDPGELANHLLPVHWLAGARDVLEGEFTPEVLNRLKFFLERSLECVMTPRERLQIWYCLRTLGFSPPEDQRDRLLGVVVEFHGEKGHSLLGVYSDRSSMVLWEDGGKKWPAWEQGTPTLLAEEVLVEAGFLGGKYGELVSDLPPLPSKDQILVSCLYPLGIRYQVVPSSDLSFPGVEVYKSAVSLYRNLVLGGGVLTELPMDLDSPRWVFPSFFSRVGAFLVDAFLFSSFLFVIFYPVRKIFLSWDILSLGFLLYFSVLVIPLLGAWMESSADWGFRTPGKRIFGQVVFSVSDGGHPTFLQALARNFSKWFLSPLFFFTGFLWAGFHRYRRAWHDVLSHTVVVCVPDGDGEAG